MHTNGRVRFPSAGLSEVGRWLLIGFVGIFVLSVVVVWIFAAILRQTGLVIFATFWTLVVAQNAYQLLLRGSFELTLDNEYLGWRGAFLRGRTLVSTLRRVRPSRVITGSVAQVIERSDGRPIVIWAYRTNKNFRTFCRALQERNPALEVRLDRSSHWLRIVRTWLSAAPRLWRR